MDALPDPFPPAIATTVCAADIRSRPAERATEAPTETTVSVDEMRALIRKRGGGQTS